MSSCKAAVPTATESLMALWRETNLAIESFRHELLSRSRIDTQKEQNRCQTLIALPAAGSRLSSEGRGGRRASPRADARSTASSAAHTNALSEGRWQDPSFTLGSSCTGSSHQLGQCCPTTPSRMNEQFATDGAQILSSSSAHLCWRQQAAALPPPPPRRCAHWAAGRGPLPLPAARRRRRPGG